MNVLPKPTTRRGFHFRRLQVTSSAAKMVRESELYMKTPVPAESASALIDEKIKDQGTRRLAREDALCRCA